MILTDGWVFFAGAITGCLIGVIVPFIALGIVIYKAGYVQMGGESDGK